MTPDEAVKHVWLAGHANQIANMVNMSISSGKQDSRKGTTKSIQSLTVRQIETGIRFCYTIPLYDSIIRFCFMILLYYSVIRFCFPSIYSHSNQSY
jgi:hypothetical protein